ncbi:hypothetical protein [Pararhizobium polonicum]|uniref:hypothetical protein n=1 Tax=Pararhizobium polonicum TaxID=1612624 RepID=UPI0013140650|nr:hypothetical protein [Pararhizobium polonicum]
MLYAEKRFGKSADEAPFCGLANRHMPEKAFGDPLSWAGGNAERGGFVRRLISPR